MREGRIGLCAKGDSLEVYIYISVFKADIESFQQRNYDNKLLGTDFVLVAHCMNQTH